MSSPFVRPKRAGFADFLGQVLGGIGDVSFSKQDPYWRMELRKKQIAQEEAEQQLETGRIQHTNARLQQGQARLGTMDKLAGLAAAGMQGYEGDVAASQDVPTERTNVGGYEMNLPNAMPEKPDFLPDEIAQQAGIDLPPSLKTALLAAAKGKVAEGKRSMEELRAQRAIQQRAFDQQFRTGERVATQGHQDTSREDQQKFLLELARMRGDMAADRAAAGRNKPRKLSSTDARHIADYDTSLNDLSTLSETLSGTHATGAAAQAGAMLPNVVTEYTGWGTDAKKKQAVIARVKQVIGKTLEGGVLRKEDEYKYEQILPTIKDPDDVAAAKIAGLRTAIEQRRQTDLDALDSAGFDTSNFGSAPAPPAVAKGKDSPPPPALTRPPWVDAIIAKGRAATPEEVERVRQWKAQGR